MTKKVLLVANVAREHVMKFHLPTIRQLTDNGWEVDVACKVDADIPYASRVFEMCWERSPFTFKTLKGICQLKKLIARNNYDIVYCHTPVGGLVARFAARGFRKNGLKVVYCAHGLHFYKGAPLLNWLIFYPMEKLMAKWTDMFITINEEDFINVKSHFNRKMRVELINGIGVNFDRLNIANPQCVRNEYRVKLGIPHDAKVLVYVAELLKNKNQGMLIEALHLLHDRGHKFYLLLVGPNHQNGEFEALAGKYGLNDYVKFLGWRNDIGELMSTSDICVASSIREGFGINLIEAQYCHLPVIASSNRGHRAIIKDGINGFLVPLHDAEAMASRIIEIIEDKELYDRMSDIDVGAYSCVRVAETIEKLLECC